MNDSPDKQEQAHAGEQAHPDEHGDCSNLLGSLSDYIDGSLNEQLCIEIERHAATCENCRIVIDTLEKTVYLVHAAAEAEDTEMPEDVKDRLFKCLDLEDFLED